MSLLRDSFNVYRQRCLEKAYLYPRLDQSLHPTIRCITIQEPTVAVSATRWHVGQQSGFHRSVCVLLLVMVCSCNFNTAYVLNLRGDDIPFNPVFVSYMYIGLDRAILFVEQEKIEPPVREYLQNLKVEIRDYNGIWSFLRTREWGEGKVRIAAISSRLFRLIAL
jgi:Creatinase/Prolidase N-terminal domain